MKEEYCPICPNHCSKENLRCGKGKEHFGVDNYSIKAQTIEEEVITDLRKCGHLLHHNKELNINELLSVFSKEELNQLHNLLPKIYMNR